MMRRTTKIKALEKFFYTMQKKVLIGKEFPQEVIQLLKAAKTSIFIIVFDWRWYPDQIGSSCQQFNNEIVQAQRRGVSVKVLTNTYTTVQLLKGLGIDARHWSRGHILHVKLMVIDGVLAVTGSHNYTMNAFNMNFEASVIVDDMAQVKILQDFAQNLWLS